MKAMSWKIAAAAVAAFFGVAWLTRRPPTSVQPLKARPPVLRSDSILLIGASHSVGLSAPLGQLSRADGIPFETNATSGMTIVQWSTRTISPQTSVVLVSLGTNDVYAGEAHADRLYDAIPRLLDKLQANGARVYWIGIPTLPLSGDKVRAITRQFISPERYFPSERLAIPRQPDGIHPTGEGYRLWAEAIWAWLR